METVAQAIVETPDQAVARLQFWQLMVLSFAPATIASLLAMFGPLLIKIFDDRRENRLIRRAKFERVIALVNSTPTALSQFSTERIFKGEKAVLASPMPEIMTIVTGYFPNLMEAAKELDLQYSAHELWVMNAAAQASTGKYELTDSFRVSWQAFLVAKRDFLDQVKIMSPLILPR